MMEYTINNYRYKRFGKKYFVTTDHGSYCILSEREFDSLKKNKINENLRKRLDEAELIVSKDNLNEVIRLSRNRMNFLYKGTSLHIIVVTLRCNMNCVYCHASSKPCSKNEFDMDRETAKNTVDFIFQSPNKYITIEFQGGEPLLNWEIVKFITNYAMEKNQKAKKDLRITIVTNLSLMDEKKMDFLIKNKVSICTSLDGHKELHDKNRKFVKGSNYEQVVYWIKKLNREYGKRKIKQHVGALVTLTKESLKYPEKIVNEYLNLGIDAVHLRFLNKLGVAKNTWNEIGYSVEEYLSFWKKATSYISALRKKGKKISERMVNIMINKIENEYDPNYLDLRSPCGAVIGQLVYDYDGNIYSCDEARMIKDDLFMLGNVKKDSYSKITTSNKAFCIINSSINDQYTCNDCVYKPYCGVCPVCNYADYGSLAGRVPESDRCKIFKEQFDFVVKERFIKQPSK